MGKGVREKDDGETILAAVSIPQPHDQGTREAEQGSFCKGVVLRDEVI